MNLILDNKLINKYNISFVSLYISEEGKWENKKCLDWTNLEETSKFALNIDTDLSFKIILVCVNSICNIFHLVSKRTYKKNEDLNLSEPDFFYITDLENHYKKGCSYPWLSPIITSEGDVTICCNDNYIEMKLGNINQKDFKELWIDCEQIKKYRYSHICGEYNNMKICQRCLGIKSRPLSEKLVQEYCDLDYQLMGMQKLYKARINKKKIFKYLYLELTDICQLKCVYCNQKYSDWKKVHGISKKGYMEVKKIQNFLEKFQDNYFFENICLFWFGEPLLHPDFSKIIEIFREKKDLFSKIEIHTNGISLDNKITQTLKSVSFPLKIHFSVDAFFKQTYLSLKGIDKLEIVNKNIKNFLKECKEKIYIQNIIQYIVCEQNVQEINSFIDYWKSFLDNNNMEKQVTTYFDFNKKNIIYLRALDPLEQDNYDKCNKLFLDVRNNIEHIGNEGYIDYSLDSGEKLNICSDPFEFLLVRYDGMLTHCCHDVTCKSGEFNIFDSSIDDFELYIKDFYKRFLNNKIEICKDCFIKKSINSHKIELKKVLKILNLFEIHPKYILRGKN